MALPEAHAAVLRRLSRELTAAGIAHGVGGSGLLALLGLPVGVRDLDIEVEPGGFDKLAGLAALRTLTTSHPYAEHGPIIRTDRGDVGGGRMLRGQVDSVPVEIFEHPGVLTDAGWRALPLRITGAATLDGDEIPLADSGFWWALYSRLNPAKAALLAPLVAGPERDRAAAELGLTG